MRLTWVDGRARHQLDQQSRTNLTQLAARLAKGRECRLHVVGEFDAIETHHRNVIRDLDPGRADRLHKADRHFVICCEQRGGTPALSHESHRRSDSGSECEVASIEARLPL